MVFGLLVGGGSGLGRGVDRGRISTFKACPGLEDMSPMARDSVLLNGSLGL